MANPSDHRSPPPPPGSSVHQLFRGAGYLGRGFRLWATSPRLMLLGVVPALVVGAVYVTGIVLIVLNVDALAVWLTPFAEEWSELWRTLGRTALTLAIVVVAVLVAVYTFAAVTLVVGDPFYERIWMAVENRLGDAPQEESNGFWSSTGRALGDALRSVIPAVGVGVMVFVCGLVPGVGTVLAIGIGAVFGGWLLVVELTGFAFDARGFTLAQRRRVLATNRPRSLGFGILTYLLFLVPLVAVVAMPTAVAGAAMLARDALAEAGHHDQPAKAAGAPRP